MSLSCILYMALLLAGTQTRLGEATHASQHQGTSSPDSGNKKADNPRSQGYVYGISDMVEQASLVGNDAGVSPELVLGEPRTNGEVDTETLKNHRMNENEGDHVDDPTAVIRSTSLQNDVTSFTRKNLRNTGRKVKVVINNLTRENRPLTDDIPTTLKTSAKGDHRSLRLSQPARHDIFDGLFQTSIKVQKNVSCASKNSKNVYVCHYDERRSQYMTLCLRKKDLDQYMTIYVNDRRGRCSDLGEPPNLDTNEGCPSAARPTCDDRNRCTNDAAFCRESISAWRCIHTQKPCRSGTRCDPTDGQCKSLPSNVQRCPSPAPSCDDSNPCTDDSAFCQASTSVWECIHSPKVCSSPGTSCDAFDGQCKADDKLVPCVAVIDEDNGFAAADKWQQWEEFRTLYPRRPFCLLIPAPIPYLSHQNVSIPENFIPDDLTISVFGIPRDHGVTSLANDWTVTCRLDGYNSANVGWVGLFIDVSGSMSESQVAASRDLFIDKLYGMGIEVKKVVNNDENWILPFMTTLAP